MRSPATNFIRQIPGIVLVSALLVAPVSGLALNTTKIGLQKNVLDRTVTGTVTSKSDNIRMPGVNVILKGTQRGTTTDAEGRYSIDVPDGNATLIFSFVGYQASEAAVGNRSVVDASLAVSSENLNEVVVTALGIKREERSLGYNVGKVEGKEMTKVVQENVLNSISGRIAGVTVNATGGTGSSVSMVIRGATSLNSDNQPLFVIDGVPIANTLNNVSQIGNNNRVDYGNAISGLNPEDIENISVLKGPSAAALYGSRAGNGVVLITTKSGAKNKKMTVSVNSSTVFDKPYRFLKWQTQFGSGQFSGIPADISGNPYSNPFGKIVDESVGGTGGGALDKGYKEIQWNSPVGADGKKIPLELVSHPNNAENFLQTGVTTTSNVAIANNTDLITYRISYNNMRNKGIIPNTDLFRNTLNLNVSTKVHEKVRLSTNLDLSRNNSNNRPSGNTGSNPLEAVYELSPHIDVRDLQQYWMPGQEGLQQRTPYNGVFNNPYFLSKEIKNSFVRDRVFGNIKADYQITPKLSLMGRVALDTYNEQRESKIATSYVSDPRGAYGLIGIKGLETNTDFLATLKEDIKDFSFSISAGGNYRYQTGSSVTNTTKGGTGLIVPGVYTLQNILPDNLNYSSSLSKRGIYSVYGLANIGFKDMVFLDVTARNDWSSTLPKGNNSYFYPSASLSVLVSEMLPDINALSLFKFRGGVAQVGNDASPYQLETTLANAGTWGSIPRLSVPNNLLINNLKPEIATSYEAGVDLNLFQNRLRMSGTYYVVENRNQILSTKLPPSSGYIGKNINAGLLVSKGVEFSLGGTPIQTENLRWDINTNISRNRTRIMELADDIPYFTLWSDAKGGAWTYVGEEIGDIYDAKLVTVTDQSSPYYGYPLLDRNGKWQSVDAIQSKNKIGNFNPKFIMGMQTSLTYKGVSLSLSFDWRNGGDFVSQTYRYGEEHMRSQLFLDKLINPNGMSGDELENYLIANQETMIKVNGGNFPVVGGPTPDYGSFPVKYSGIPLPHGGAFVPGVIANYDAAGNLTGYTKNLGGSGTVYQPIAGLTTWSFTKPFTYDASFIKLREVAVGYELPTRWVKRIGLQNANVSVYSRNIMLWTAARIGIDPETAFQVESGVQGNGMQFKQGIERYNVTPWVMPVGFKVGLTF
jgi:TonB-linked SusC/RagA family outer membrane protein